MQYRLKKTENANPGAVTVQDKVKLIEKQIKLRQLERERRRRSQQGHQEFVTEVIDERARRQATVNAYPFKQYIIETFPVIEQGRQFSDNWHIDIICLLFQAALLGDIKDFIVNQPRRTMKSLIGCVMFPTWVWTFLPHIRFLYTSYSAKFAGRDNKKCHSLINSQYYKNRWGHIYHLTTQKLASELWNSEGGFRQVFPIGGGTGEGGDFIFADDPNDIKKIESQAILDKTNYGWKEISYHNVTDKNTAVRAIIQQRTDPEDLTGSILDDLELKKLYQVLCLPMKFEADHPNKNSKENPLYLGKVSIFDRSTNPNLVVGEDKLWIDPRDLDAPDFDNIWYQEWYRINFTQKGLTSQGEDQLLWETFMPKSVVEKDIAHLKVHGEAGQFQQRPTPRGGQFFNSELFKIVKADTLDLNNLRLMRYFDKAGSDGAGDWTVGTLMARTKTRPFQFYILDMHRVQLSYFGRMAEMKKIAKQDMENYVLSKTNCDYTIGIEREGGSSGKDVSLIEKEELVGYDVWIDYKKVSKESRASIVRQRSEGGYIKVVENHVWNKIFLKRLEKYDPKKANQKDDEIDTIGGCLYYLAFMLIQQYSSSDSYS